MGKSIFRNFACCELNQLGEILKARLVKKIENIHLHVAVGLSHKGNKHVLEGVVSVDKGKDI